MMRHLKVELSPEIKRNEALLFLVPLNKLGVVVLHVLNPADLVDERLLHELVAPIKHVLFHLLQIGSRVFNDMGVFLLLQADVF